MIHKHIAILACCIAAAVAQLNVAESFTDRVLLTQTAHAVAGGPMIIDSDGLGFADLVYDGDRRQLNARISFQNLTGSPTIAHFHGAATVTEIADVQVDLTPNLPDTPTGTFSVVSQLDDAQHMDILSGLWYINIHTDEYPAGEIRGQINVNGRGIPESTIVVNRAIVPLTTDQTNPRVAVDLEANGQIEVQVTNTDPAILSWALTFAGLSDSNTPIFGHFHGPAPLGQNAGVQVNISSVPFSSPNVGQMSLSAEQYDQLLQGLWYVNLHTSVNMAGEVRGQLVGFEQAIVEGNVDGLAPASTTSPAASLLVTLFVTLFVASTI